MVTKMCFIDTETTGVDCKANGLIQIAGIITEFDTQNGTNKPLTSFDIKMQPFKGKILTKEAMAVTGITKEEMLTYQSPMEAYNKFIKILGSYVSKFDKKDKFIFAGYNARFDFDFIRSFFEDCGDSYMGSWFYFPPIDIMNLSIFNLFEMRSKLPNFKLATVAEYLKIEPDGTYHNAMADISQTMKIFEYFYQNFKKINIMEGGNAG